MEASTCFWWEKNTKMSAVGGKGQWKAFPLNVNNTEIAPHTKSVSQSPKRGLTPQECGFGRKADREPLISHPKGP